MDLLLIRLMRAVALPPRQLLIYPHGYTDNNTFIWIGRPTLIAVNSLNLASYQYTHILYRSFN
jgi:hypothetical protein